MSVEVRPLGVNCNIGCLYCYQNPQRDAGNLTKKYDLKAIKKAVKLENDDFILFGGEPLMVPLKDLEELWAWGFEKYGKNGVQTNGTLITEAHIRLFKKYNVQVGISMDGPGALNDVRWAGSLEKTRALTRKSEEAIASLIQAGAPPSLIITLHQGNATEEKLPMMHEWIRKLDSMGVPAARLHILEVESADIRQKFALSPVENIKALLSFADLEPQLKQLQLDVFRDMEGLLKATDHYVSCVWRACDPYTTTAVRGVEGRGQRSNCGRTNKEGIDFIKSDQVGYERYLALYHTPQEYGGCKGCRFYLMCKGQCPGTAIDGDWRNRSEHCEVWMNLFEQLETRLLKQGTRPISLDPNLIYLEREMLAAWEAGRNPALADKLNEMIVKYQESVPQ